MSSDAIGKFFTSSGKKIWKERDKKQWIVLTDEDSTAERLRSAASDVPILALKDTIYKVGNR